MQPRTVPCQDVAGRPGSVGVVVRDREAVLTVPPGEAAHLTGPELSELIEVLRAARDELYRRDT